MATAKQIAANKRNAQKAGRPKGAIAKSTRAALDYKGLLAIRLGEEQTEIIDALLDKAKKGDVSAIKEVIDRLFGKSTERFEGDVTTHEPIPMLGGKSQDT